MLVRQEALSATQHDVPSIHEHRALLERARTVRKLGNLALASGLVFGPVAGLSGNAYENYTTATSNSAHIDYVQPSLDADNDDNAIIMFDGLGSNNAERLADIGGALQQVTDGELWSVDYGDAPLNPNALADQIADKMDDSGKRHVTLQGYSAGGSIALAVAESLITNHHVNIPLITMIMTPNGTTGITPEQQKVGAAYTRFISNVPMAAYSDPVRFTGEMIERRHQYLDQDESVKKFFQTAQQVHTSITSGNRAAPWLVADQLLAIDTMDTDARLKHISRDTETVQPVIVYLRPDETGSDDLVDNKRSSQEICQSARTNQIDCFIYEVPGAVHNDPGKSPKEYKQTLGQNRQELINTLTAKMGRHIFAQYDLSSKS